jgi:hypothetical protein
MGKKIKCVKGTLIITVCKEMVRINKNTAIIR